MQTHAEVKVEVEVKKSSETIKAEIFLLYKNALTNVKTSHIDLQDALLRQLNDFKQFKTVIEQLVKIPPPKAIKIDKKEYKIDSFWSPKLFGGSKLRAALWKATKDEEILLVEYNAACQREQKLQSEIITKKLQADNLTWDDCEKFRDQISDWPGTLKSDLEDFINYKQAEFLFKKHILPHQSNYQGAIFAMKSVLFTLSTNYNANILNNIIDYDEQSDFFLTVDTQEFRENVCGAFIKTCQEWFRLGAALSFNHKKQDPKTLLYYFPDAEELFAQLNCPITEDHYKFNNFFKVSLESYSNSKEELSISEKHLPPTIVIMNEINAYQKNSLHTARQDLFMHRIFQYLRWIADLPCREDMAFIDKVKIKDFIKAQSEAAKASEASNVPSQEISTQTLYMPSP